VTTKTLFTTRVRCRVAAALLSGVIGSICLTGSLRAQTRYAYLPTANTKDAHFLSIAGAGFQTLGGDIVMKIASPAAAPSVEIGIFDGETGGTWDYGNVQLSYTLYADPNGDATGTTQLAQWNGADMPDNAWFSATLNNVASARGTTGDYFYMLKVTTPNPAASYLSVFKARTNGTIAIMANQPFAYIAAINSLADAQIIYPGYPTLTPTTYDGSWSFYLDVQHPQGSLDVWDGDMDYGKYDCTENDNDDPDTPNEVPAWAVGSAAVGEGIAGGGAACTDATGVAIGGTTTSNPPDDSYRPTSQRGPSVGYDVIDPKGTHYANTNPSGNVEWERFRVSTAAFDRAQMDYHAADLPAGIYQVKIAGVDMSNLNAFRFPFDALGVDSVGEPVFPIHPYKVHGVVFYDANSNGVQESGEQGIAGAEMSVGNGDMQTTDASGNYSFTVDPGTYTVVVDSTSLSGDLVVASDCDGIATRNRAVVTVGPGQADKNVFFGYKTLPSQPNASGTRTRGYWVNHTTNWPLDFITLGCITYTKAQAIAILQRPTKGDNTYAMAAQLIATKLNIAAGTDASCISATVASADAWLCQYPVGSGGKPGWKIGEPIHNKLDDYNNGRLCVPHMD
jgi:hypothetical protein